MSRAVIITGATGKQGGALIKALINANTNLDIIAMSRHPSSASAQGLTSKPRKIKVIACNLDRPDKIFENAKIATSLLLWGCTVFNMNPWDETEVRQGKALVDAAVRNGVKTFVYSSVDRGGGASYDNPTFVPHFKTKNKIEHHLVSRAKDSDMSYTILQPVAFMDNLQLGLTGEGFAAMWNIASGRKPLQLIAVSDTGVVHVRAFLEPTEHKNRALSLTGDELTYARFGQVFKDTIGRELPTMYRLLARLFLLLSREMGLMLRWLGTHGYDVEIASLKKSYPDLKTFRDWLKQESPFVKR